MAYFYEDGGSLPSRLVDFFSSFSTALILGQSQAQTLSENLKRTGLKRVIHLSSFPPQGRKMHVSDYLLQSLRPFGIEGSKVSCPLRLPGEAISFADEFLQGIGWKEGKRILAIHPGSGSPTKNWDPQKFAFVADWAYEYAFIFLISGPAHDGKNEVQQAMKKANPFIINLLPLPKLAAILGNCTVYLGNDSGITHLAAQLGIPTLALFGPTNPAVWGPRGPKVQILGRGESFTARSPKKRNTPEHQCLGRMNPEMVMERLAPFLK
jgi:ADP-heptose:LPS heptosyltransferase